jgi:hypothetical protein
MCGWRRRPPPSAFRLAVAMCRVPLMLAFPILRARRG